MELKKSEVNETDGKNSELGFDPDKLIGSEAKEPEREVDNTKGLKPVDPDKLIEPAQVEVEQKEIAGGSYREVKKCSDGETHEVHHMPAADINGLAFQDGPAIKMEKGDHRMTASCGNSREAREYRAEQSRLIKGGKFKEAMKMDIDDIHEKFGDKYDKAINQMVSYAAEKGLI